MAENPFTTLLAAAQAAADYGAQLERDLAACRQQAAQLTTENAALGQRVRDLEAEVARLRGPMEVGLNLGDWTEYNTAAQAANVLQLLTAGGTDGPYWGHPDRPWEPLGRLPAGSPPPTDRPFTVDPRTNEFILWARATPDGYPLEDAASFSYAHGYPGGAYAFRMEGSGEVSFGGKGRNVAGTFRREGGALVGQVEFRQSAEGNLRLKITGINPADPPRNARLTPPGVDPAATYTPWFLDKIRPLAGTVRFMQWGRTNGSPLVRWSDRKRPTEYSQVGRRGVSYEHMAALADALGCDVWLCVPHMADDEYVREMARFFRDRLHPRTTVWLEYSNEVWNTAGGFGQGPWLRDHAQTNPELTAPAGDWYSRWAQNAAWQIARVARIWRAEWGDSSTALTAGRSRRLRPVLGGQSAVPRWARTGLEYLQAKYGRASDVIDAITPAAYIGLPAAADQAGLTLDGLFAALDAELNGTGRLQEHADLARQYGVDLVHYEAGQHVIGFNPEIRQPDGSTRGGFINLDVKAAAQDDPRMGDLYRRLFERQQRFGARLFMHFHDIDPGGRFGWWGLWTRVDAPDGPKAAAVLQFARGT